MKPHTRNWLRLENKGKPSDTVTGEGTIRDHIMMIAEWLTKIHMGSRVIITLARTELELNRKTDGGTPELSDIQSELTDMLAGLEREESSGNGSSSHRETFCADHDCPNQTDHVAGSTGCKWDR